MVGNANANGNENSNAKNRITMTVWYQREERASPDHVSAATISQVALRIIWIKKKSREETKAVGEVPRREAVSGDRLLPNEGSRLCNRRFSAMINTKLYNSKRSLLGFFFFPLQSHVL